MIVYGHSRSSGDVDKGEHYAGALDRSVRRLLVVGDRLTEDGSQGSPNLGAGRALGSPPVLLRPPEAPRTGATADQVTGVVYTNPQRTGQRNPWLSNPFQSDFVAAK